MQGLTDKTQSLKAPVNQWVTSFTITSKKLYLGQKFFINVFRNIYFYLCLMINCNTFKLLLEVHMKASFWGLFRTYFWELIF